MIRLLLRAIYDEASVVASGLVLTLTTLLVTAALILIYGYAVYVAWFTFSR